MNWHRFDTESRDRRGTQMGPGRREGTYHLVFGEMGAVRQETRRLNRVKCGICRGKEGQSVDESLHKAAAAAVSRREQLQRWIQTSSGADYCGLTRLGRTFAAHIRDGGRPGAATVAAMEVPLVATATVVDRHHARRAHRCRDSRPLK